MCIKSYRCIFINSTSITKDYIFSCLTKTVKPKHTPVWPILNKVDPEYTHLIMIIKRVTLMRKLSDTQKNLSNQIKYKMFVMIFHEINKDWEVSLIKPWNSLYNKALKDYVIHSTSSRLNNKKMKCHYDIGIYCYN